jgi:hypothetical protein
MENKVNKILNSIKPTRREKLSKQREVKLALIDDLREHTNQLEDLEYMNGYDEISGLSDQLSRALNEVRSLAEQLKPMIEPYAENDYASMVDQAERDIDKYESAIEDLGIPMDEEVQYLKDEIIGKIWYGDRIKAFEEEPDFSFYVEQAEKLD